MVILFFNSIFNDKLNLISCVLKEKYYKYFKKIYQNFTF